MGRRSENKWISTDDDTGNVIASGWSTSETTAEGTVATDVFHIFVEGDLWGTIEHIEIKDESGKTIQETRTIWNEDGSQWSTTENADGTKTITKFNNNGEFVSVQYFDANGNEVEPPEEEGNGEFWDVDIIYGEPPLMLDSKDGFEAADMHSQIAALGEDYVDHFDFIM